MMATSEQQVIGVCDTAAYTQPQALSSVAADLAEVDCCSSGPCCLQTQPDCRSAEVMAGCLKVAQASYVDYDTSHLPAAGLRSKGAGGAGTAMTWQHERPQTPQHLKKYRLSTLHTPGQIYRHFGVADDPVDTAQTYGKVCVQTSRAVPSPLRHAHVRAFRLLLVSSAYVVACASQSITSQCVIVAHSLTLTCGMLTSTCGMSAYHTSHVV